MRIALLLALSFFPALAAAQLEDPELRALREGVVPYGATSIAAIEGLARYRSEPHRARDVDLARYLHAIASADLWIVARRNDDAALQAQLARAHGVGVDALPRTLERTLAAVRFGAFVSEVDDALAALAGRAPRGAVRGDLLFVDALGRALRSEAPVSALAALADADPCVESEPCPDTLRLFDDEGRRAVAAVLAGQRAERGIRARAAAGDPLAHAALVGLDRDPWLPDVELAPRVVALPEIGALAQVAGHGPQGPFEVVLHVDGDTVRYAFAPRVRFDTEGAHLVARRGPVMPQYATVTLPAQRRAVPVPVPELVALLRSFGDARVAFAPSPTSSTTDLWRVLRSAEAAHTSLALAALDAEGRVCVRPLEWREEASSPAEVYVRLGGYSIHAASGAHDVPRVRLEDGWSYDAAQLRSLVGEAPTVAVRAMHDMPVAPVVDALFVAHHTLLVRR